MQEKRRNVMVGIFVLVGLAIMGIMIVLFGQGAQWMLRGQTYPLCVRFDRVSGIRSGNLVTVKGIKIGTVDYVQLQNPRTAAAGPAPSPAKDASGILVAQDMGVTVVLAIENQYLIPQGSTAQTTEPVLGQGRPAIEIIPGPPDAQPLPPGAIIPGTIRGGLESILPARVVTTLESMARQVGDAAEALTPVLEQLKDITEKRSPQMVDAAGGPQGNLSSALARLDSSLKHFNEVLGDNQVKSDLRETVANAREMSEKGKKVMDDLGAAAEQLRQVGSDAQKLVTRADDTLANFDGRVAELSRAAMDSFDRVDRVLDHLNVVGQQVTRGEGNLGRLVMDGRLYEAMVITAERLSLAVEEFRALIAEWREGKIRVSL